MSDQLKRTAKEISLSPADEAIVILDGSLQAFKTDVKGQFNNKSHNVTMNCHFWIQNDDVRRLLIYLLDKSILSSHMAATHGLRLCGRSDNKPLNINVDLRLYKSIIGDDVLKAEVSGFISRKKIKRGEETNTFMNMQSLNPLGTESISSSSENSFKTQSLDSVPNVAGKTFRNYVREANSEIGILRVKVNLQEEKIKRQQEELERLKNELEVSKFSCNNLSKRLSSTKASVTRMRTSSNFSTPSSSSTEQIPVSVINSTPSLSMTEWSPHTSEDISVSGLVQTSRLGYQLLYFLNFLNTALPSAMLDIESELQLHEKVPDDTDHARWDQTLSKQNEFFRQLKSLLYFIIAPESFGRGVANPLIPQTASLLGIHHKSKLFTQAIKNKAQFTEELLNCQNEEDVCRVLRDWIKLEPRKRRSDAISSDDLELIKSAWNSCSEVSPEANDIVRRYKLKKDETGNRWDAHQRHYFYGRIVDIQNYITDTLKERKFSISILSLHKPYYVCHGVDNTCLCENCENMAELIKAARSNKSVLNKPFIKFWASKVFTAFFLAINTRRIMYTGLQLEGYYFPKTLKITIIFYLFRRYFQQAFSIWDLVQGASKFEVVSKVLCSRALPAFNHMGRRACFSKKEGSCQRCKNLERLRFEESQITYDITNTNEFNPFSIVDADKWRNDDKVNYNYWKSGDLHSTSVHPLQFGQIFQEMLISYKYHYALKLRQRNLNQEQLHHCGTDWLIIDLDFAENLTYNCTINRTQSSHWKSYQLTLLISVIRYLNEEVYKDVSIVLKKGDEVSFRVTSLEGIIPSSVDPELLCYGIVHENQDRGIPFVKVRAPYLNNSVYELPRGDVYKREFVMTPLITASNDKHHDTYFVQTFFKNTFLSDDGWYNKQALLKERLKNILIRTDGAASHFKQKYTLLFFAKELLKCFKRAIWYFGAPGHGKGTHDGIGGIVKGSTVRAIRRGNLIFENTDSGKFNLFKLMQSLFCDDEAQERYGKDKYVIDTWNFQWIGSSEVMRSPDIERQEDGDIMAFRTFGPQGGLKTYIGTRDLFEFEAISESNEQQHQFKLRVKRSGCGCAKCMSHRDGCVRDEYDILTF